MNNKNFQKLLGRVCRTSTSVATLKEFSACGSFDPNNCVVGDVCPDNYFCPKGSSEISDKNSCLELKSFSGARERFFCTLKDCKIIKQKYLIFIFIKFLLFNSIEIKNFS